MHHAFLKQMFVSGSPTYPIFLPTTLTFLLASEEENISNPQNQKFYVTDT